MAYKRAEDIQVNDIIEYNEDEQRVFWRQILSDHFVMLWLVQSARQYDALTEVIIDRHESIKVRKS